MTARQHCVSLLPTLFCKIQWPAATHVSAGLSWLAAYTQQTVSHRKKEEKKGKKFPCRDLNPVIFRENCGQPSPPGERFLFLFILFVHLTPYFE
jgi:hypothetical protein